MSQHQPARAALLDALSGRPGRPRSVNLTWRQVYLDYQPGIALTCDTPHPGIPDMDIEHDTEGIYDCCPPLFIEVGNDIVGAYLVEALNAAALTADPAALRAQIFATLDQPLPCTRCGKRQHDECGVPAGAPSHTERVTSIVWDVVAPAIGVPNQVVTDYATQTVRPCGCPARFTHHAAGCAAEADQ